MSCAITKGRNLGCKPAYAGIKNVYILDYSAVIEALGDTNGTITLPTDNSAEFFKFELKVVTHLWKQLSILQERMVLRFMKLL